jgi:hypothetical protein
MEKEFQARAAATANNLQPLKNSVNEIAADLGTTLPPSINQLVGGINTKSHSKSVVISGDIFRLLHPIFSGIC